MVNGGMGFPPENQGMPLPNPLEQDAGHWNGSAAFGGVAGGPYGSGPSGNGVEYFNGEEGGGSNDLQEGEWVGDASAMPPDGQNQGRRKLSRRGRYRAKVRQQQQFSEGQQLQMPHAMPPGGGGVLLQQLVGVTPPPPVVANVKSTMVRPGPSNKHLHGRGGKKGVPFQAHPRPQQFGFNGGGEKKKGRGAVVHYQDRDAVNEEYVVEEGDLRARGVIRPFSSPPPPPLPPSAPLPAPLPPNQRDEGTGGGERNWWEKS